VLTTADGGLELKGALLETVSSETQLSHLLSRVFAARATEATAGNSTSSRSHMIVSIDVPPTRTDISRAEGGPAGAPGLSAPSDAVRFGRSSRPALVGRLTLVDCAGSEWAADSAIHCKSRQREGAEINTSLHALKQCVRAFSERTRTGRPVRMPFRDSMLTRLLADSFQGSASPSGGGQGECRLAVLGCVSPTSAATEHSISTLRTVMELAGASEEAASWTTPVRRVRCPGEPDWPPPGGSWFGCSC
jgi:kinesin family protein 2/24